jgi:hypothetical protein
MSKSSIMDSSASAVVRDLIELGTAIPIIKTFAEALKKVFEVIEQASRNEDAIVRLRDHAVDISERLLPRLSDLSRITGFDDALNKLMDLLKKISSYINNHNQNSLVTKAMSATDTNLVTKVDDYIQKLTAHEGRLMALINIDTNRIVTDIAEAKRNSNDDFPHSVPFKEDYSRSRVNQDEESSTDEKAVSKNAQESKFSNK